MVAARGCRRNFGAPPARGDTAAAVLPAAPLLALRLAGQDHALEPGRDYLLGSAADCDLSLPPPAAARHARLSVGTDGLRVTDLGSAAGTTRNGERIAAALLAVGDVLDFGGAAAATVVADDGRAAIVPVPTLRAAAVARRQAMVRDRAQALRHPGSQTLAERMRDELRHAPWLFCSLALHLLLLLLAWLVLPHSDPSGSARATVAVDLRDGPPPGASPPLPPEVAVEPAEPPFAPPAPPEPPAPPASEEPPDGARPRPALPPGDTALGATVAPPAEAARPAHGTDVDGLGSAGFQRTVADLRQSGLELVFVVDSTGSMTRTIHDTRTSLAQMLAVLQALVPDARIGLVSYRDRGPREQYLVQQTPLGADPWRAGNFVQFLTAEGGGDRPEDVRAGLLAAFRQPWRPGARRVVVLAGDAPPHAEDQSRLLAEVRAFARDGRSFVHALVVSPEHAGRDTHAAFAAIAAAGHGVCEGLAQRDRVLQRVLTLAFGREFDRDLAAVVRAVETAAARVDTRSLDLVRRGGPELARALRQEPLPQPLWNALVRRPQRAVAEQLIDMLGADGTAEPTRHALAAALQRLLELPLPPIDPVAPQRPAAAELAQLRARAARLPD